MTSKTAAAGDGSGAQPCFGGRRRVAVGPGGGSRRGWDGRPGGGTQGAGARRARRAGAGGWREAAGEGEGPAAGKEAGRLGAGRLKKNNKPSPFHLISCWNVNHDSKQG